MSSSRLIIELLQDHWADECDAVGPTNLEDIVEGNTTFESASGGSYIDLGGALITVAAASTFIKNAIDIYKAIRNQDKTPQPSELRQEMQAKKLEPTEIDRMVLDDIYNSICNRLKNTDSNDKSKK